MLSEKLGYHHVCGHVHERHEDCATIDWPPDNLLPATVLEADGAKATEALAAAIRLWLMVPDWADPYFLQTRPHSRYPTDTPRSVIIRDLLWKFGVDTSMSAAWRLRRY